MTFCRSTYFSIINSRCGRLTDITSDYYANSNLDIEMDIIENVLAMYIKDVPQDQQGEFTKKIGSKGSKGIAKFMKSVKKKSIFGNKAKFEAFLKNPTLKISLITLAI